METSGPRHRGAVRRVVPPLDPTGPHVVESDRRNGLIGHQTLNEFVKEPSPTERMFSRRNALEPMLGPRARALGADIRFNTELGRSRPTLQGERRIRDRATTERRGARGVADWDDGEPQRRRQQPASPCAAGRAVQEHTAT